MSGACHFFMASDHRGGFSLRLYRTLLILLLGAYGTVPAVAASGAQTPPEPVFSGYGGAQSAVLPLRSAWNSDWAVGDLNGDAWPDVVRTEAIDRGYRVNINLSGSSALHSIDVRVARFAGINVEARDIDGDHDLDLVITAGLIHRPVLVPSAVE